MMNPSQEKSQQTMSEELARIAGMLEAQVKGTSFDEEVLVRKLHCGQHSTRHEAGYVQTDDGTRWEFRKGDAVSVEGGCLVIRTDGHDGRGNEGHAEILIALSKIVAVVIE